MRERRKSTEYLMTIPFKFAATLSMVFILIYAFLSYLEFNAAATPMIGGHLPQFSLMLATFFSIDGLVIMLMEFVSRRMSESRLVRYLKRLEEESVV